MKKTNYAILIFDLDDTLFDTTTQCYPAAAQASCEAMIDSGLKADLSSCLTARKELTTSGRREDVFSKITEKFGVSKKMTPEAVAKIGFEAFYSREVEPNIHVFPQVYQTLAQLKNDYQMFLVTMGDPVTQEQKVKLLRLASFFQQVVYVDPSKKQTKTEAFRHILLQTRTDAEKVLCIGNRLDQEISQAKALGICTCLVNSSGLEALTPVLEGKYPDYKIQRISEIIDICQL